MLPDAIITPDQCRAARGLLDLSQVDLCELAGVSRTSVGDFESGKPKPYATTVKKIRNALEAAGAVFVDENGGGPGVRLTKPKDKYLPPRQ